MLGGLVLLVAAIGFSRVYSGVQHVAGVSAGLALLLLAIGVLHPPLRRT